MVVEDVRCVRHERSIRLAAWVSRQATDRRRPRAGAGAELEPLFSEPNALNVAPNRTLRRAGFVFNSRTRQCPAQLTFLSSRPPNRFMTHLAMQQVDDQGNAVIWGKHVSDEEYSAAP